MMPCESPLAAQIGFQVANLSKNNYKSVAKELCELISYGLDGSIILLRNCLEQVNLAEDDQNLQVKFDLLTLVIRSLIHQPNFGTVLCEALRILPCVSDEFLANLCRALNLTLPEQIALGLALADAEDFSLRQQGLAFFEIKVKDLCQNPVSDISEDLIERILWYLYSSEALLKLRSSFLKSMPALQPFALESLIVVPFLNDASKELNTLREFNLVVNSGSLMPETVLMDLEQATDVASLMEELGFDCTYSVDHCKEVLSYGGPLLEGDIARILGTVARTAKGLEEVQNIHGSFCNTLCKGEPVTSKLTSWHVDILLGAINQMNPSLDWSLIVSSLDFEGFFLPDENAFTLFMTMYKLGCEDPFPLDAIFSHVWKNDEGQLSFLRHAISAAPEVFSFSHSARKLMETEDGNLKSPNHAWLSLDLLEVLCRLAELGHADQVREILEFPRNQCPELLALGLVQVSIDVSLKGSHGSFQQEILSLTLRPQFSRVHFSTEDESIAPLWSKLWSINPEVLKMEMINFLISKDLSAYGRVLQICRGLKVLPEVLNIMPSQVALELAVFASRIGLLNLEVWLEEEVSIHRDSFASACLSFLEERQFMLDEANGAIEHSENQQSDISATILKVLSAASGLLSSGDLVNEITSVRGSESANSLDANMISIESSPQEFKEIDVDKEANLYFERVYHEKVPVQTVVNMLQQFNRSPPNSREKAIFSRMITCLFDELPLIDQYPDNFLAVTAALFGSLIKHQLVSSSNLDKILTFILEAFSKPVGSKMFSFAIQALNSFRERLEEWPEFCYHILQVPHIHEAHDEIVDYIMNIVKASHTADPNAVINNSHDPSVVALPTIVNAPTSVLQDSQDEIYNSAFAAVNPAGNRFSSAQLRQLRYPSGQGLDALLQTTTGSFSSTVGGQQPQSDSQSALDSLLSSQPGLQTNAQSLFQPISRAPSATSLQFPVSQYSSTEERSDGVSTPSAKSEARVKESASTRTTEISGPSQYSSTDSTSLSTAAPYFPFSAAANGQAVSSAVQSSNRPRSANAGSLRTAISGFGHALNIETLVAAAGKRDTPIEAPSSDTQDKVAFIINNISWTNLEAKAKECVEVLTEEYHPWFAQYIVMKRASIEPNNHDTYIKFLDKMNSKELQKEVLKTTYENCKVLLGSNLIKTHSEERSLLKNLGSWLGKLTIRRNQALRAREIDPKSLIIRAYQKGLMIAIIPFTSKVLEPCNQSLAYQPPNPWTMAILSLLVEIYNQPNLKMNLKFDIEVLFKNLSVDMKDLKPSKLLEGLERELEGNPDFSNKDPVFSQSPSPAPSASDSAQSVAAPSLPQQLDIPPELPIVTQPVTSMSSVNAQLNEEERPSLALERTQNGQVSSTSLQSQSSFSSSQVSMAIPDLTSYVVLNSKLAGLSQQLQLARFVPLAMERAIREIISPVVDRSVTIACMTTRELVVKDYAMEADESRTNQSANLMVASLAGSLAHVTCKEPLRVAMANYLRSLMQTAISQDVLEQAVNLVTNDNLDLGCAVIEKAATEKAQRDLEEVIAPVLAVRRADRLRTGSAYYEKYIYTNQNLTPLPEALRPRPGRLSSAQARVYEDFARLPWQNQPSHTPATSAGPPGITSLTARGAYPVPGRESGATTVSLIGTQSPSAPGTSQVSDVSSDELDIRDPAPLRFSSTTSGGGVEGQVRLPQDSSLLFQSYTNASTPLSESNVVEVTTALKGMLGNTQSSTTPLPAEQVGLPVQDPSLTTGEALEKYSSTAQKLDLALSRASSQLSLDDEVRMAMNEIPEIIMQCVSRDEAALAIAQKVFKRLYENTTSQTHVRVHLGILESIRYVCKRVVKELTSWVVYSDEDRKFNREITVGLIRSELINLTDYNLHLAKWIDGGRNKDAVDFAAYLVKTCVIEEAGVSSTEFYNVIDALDKLAARPGSPESLQQLVEIAKGTPNKDDKGRLSKEKKQPPSVRVAGPNDAKSNMRETAAGDPPGLRDQATQFFQEWARICNTPGGTNDKAIYISQLQSTGMLKGDDITDRFFRILLELAESHCLNSETPQPSTAVGEPRQQEASNLSFAAIDMVAKLVVLLLKYSSDLSLNKVNLLNKVLNVTVRLMKRDNDRKTGFHPRPYFRLFVTWLMDFNSQDTTPDSSNFQVLSAFAYAFLALQPLDVPGFSFAWLELISHRTFMPKLLLSNSQKGWPLFQRLLVALFRFMEPYLRNAALSEPVRLLYKGTLRVLLVLLHDFPEFLCDHHFSFCDVIPPSCIQMRNLILSAFPRNMRLPDPFTPNLKVDLLPEISQSPRILSDVEAALKAKQLKTEVDDFIKNRNQSALTSMDFKGRLSLSPQEALASGTRYNVPLLNALVLYVGMQAVQQLHSKTSQQLHSKTSQQLAALTQPITHSAPMDIFQRLVNDLDTEGRYLFLNAVANQLRYPNNHTYYFSCVLLFLFAEASAEIIQEQITRVLLERLIVNRPHPWGLLITFIELIKNPRYSFWTHSFTRCAPEIDKLFESVARSCMTPALKPSDDDLPGSLSADGLKG